MPRYIYAQHCGDIFMVKALLYHAQIPADKCEITQSGLDPQFHTTTGVMLR